MGVFVAPSGLSSRSALRGARLPLTARPGGRSVLRPYGVRPLPRAPWGSPSRARLGTRGVVLASARLMTTSEVDVFQLSSAEGEIVLPALLGALSNLEVSLRELRQTRTGRVSIVTLAVTTSVRAAVAAAIDAHAANHGYAVRSWTTEDPRGPKLPSLCVTLLGTFEDPGALSSIFAKLDELGLVVRETRTLGRPAVHGLEIFAERRARDGIGRDAFETIRRELLRVASERRLDIAVQRDDLFRRNKRLLCMDVDSTFVKGEFIDELAELCGIKPAVAEITARAMRGELDFKAALRERVKLLAGLPMERAMTLCEKYELSPGAEDLVRSAKRLGIRVGLVSGGFSFFVSILEKRYGLDFTFANELEIEGGKLTGNVLGTIVDAERKEQVLRDMAHVYGICMEQTVATGDGANDILMLKAAGLGVAYQAKPKLQEVADAILNEHDRLDSILSLMGFDAPELHRSFPT